MLDLQISFQRPIAAGTAATAGEFIEFDQSEFGGYGLGYTGMGSTGYVYVPSQCADGTAG